MKSSRKTAPFKKKRRRKEEGKKSTGTQTSCAEAL